MTNCSSLTPATQIFLIGNPNAGKSTVFNRLTGSRVHTGNWNGVTVSATTKIITHAAQNYSVTDLPGIYGMTAFSQDEANAIAAIERNPEAIFVNIVDINTLEKSLNLTIQLLDHGARVILLPNFTTTAKKRGLVIDYHKLSACLGVPICTADPHSRTFAAEFMDFVAQNSPATHPKASRTSPARKAKISQIISSCITQSPSTPYAFTRLDNILTNRFLGIPIFLIIMLATFWLTFGIVGSTFSDCLVSVWELFAKSILNLLSLASSPAWLASFVGEGILNSVGGIIGFLPQICLLWLCLEFLEQSGYISRIVWLLEPKLNRLGLSGKSAFPLLLGFGCTTLATPTVLAIKSRPAREKTASILPFINCNAKLPVLLCIASAIFPEHTPIIIFLLYILGVVVAVSVAAIWQKLRPTPSQNEIFEFTPLCLPSFTRLLSKTLLTAARFLRKIWSIVLIFGVIIWFISNFDFALCPTEIQNSMLASLAQIFTPIFAPLGLGLGSVIALIVGIVAKEMVLSCIAVLNSTTVISASLIDPMAFVHFDIYSGVAFLVFCCLYTPCVSALAQLRAVLPRRQFFVQILLQFCVAYGMSLLISTIIKSLAICGFGGVTCVLVVAILCAFLFYIGLKRRFINRKCDRNCNFCNRT